VASARCIPTLRWTPTPGRHLIGSVTAAISAARDGNALQSTQ